MIKKTYTIDDSFKLKSLHWASSFNHFSFLNFNEQPYHFGAYPCMVAVDCLDSVTTSSKNGFEELKNKYNKQWLFGYLGYDLKNEVENLNSANQDQLKFSDIYFFQPRHILNYTNDQVEIISNKNPDELFIEINSYKINSGTISKNPIKIKERVSKEEYIKTIQKIKTHLLEGDIYELNYCMEFYAENSVIDPLQTFTALNKLSPMPFSAFMRINNQYLISASPERFLKKEKDRLISQPIKGTIKRGKNAEEDELLKSTLLNSEKERAENMMIVDLVRNDLAKSSKYGTVKVDELFGIYSFNQLHQMISTICSEIKDDLHFIDAIRNAFPMGSMTGAPKIKAMELIEELENTKRGLFSGAAGFISPEEDFDFNVVIRSIIYSQDKNYLSYQVGSAVTYDSDPEKEYDECILKAGAMRKVLEGNVEL